MATGFIMVDTPNTRTPQGTYPRRGGARLSGTCIVHTSEGNWTAGVNSLTTLVRTRADYGCYHQACDWADIARYYPWEWEAWQDTETNNWAVGIAAACRTTDWNVMPADIREGYYRNMAAMAADFVRYMRTKGIEVPRVRITGAQARARVPGFCAHGDSGISRTDPGVQFDWARFFNYTNAALGAVNQQGSTKEEEMPTPEDVASVVLNKRVPWMGFGGVQPKEGRTDTTLAMQIGWLDTQFTAVYNQQAAAQATIANLVGAVAALAKGEEFDEAKLLAGVRAAAEAGVKNAIASIETTVTLAKEV